jgi:hypothetical protein
MAAHLRLRFASPERVRHDAGGHEIDRDGSADRSSSRKSSTMWYLDSGLAEMVGLVYRLCTVIWGN